MGVCVERRAPAPPQIRFQDYNKNARTSAEAGVGANRPHSTDAPHCRHNDRTALGRRVRSGAAAVWSSRGSNSSSSSGRHLCWAKVKLVSRKQRRMLERQVSRTALVAAAHARRVAVGHGVRRREAAVLVDGGVCCGGSGASLCAANTRSLSDQTHSKQCPVRQ
eukprot:COSAG06_NODE_11144_length_1557_cov_2.814815_2_plen_164_part_00